MCYMSYIYIMKADDDGDDDGFMICNDDDWWMMKEIILHAPKEIYEENGKGAKKAKIRNKEKTPNIDL